MHAFVQQAIGPRAMFYCPQSDSLIEAVKSSRLSTEPGYNNINLIHIHR